MNKTRLKDVVDAINSVRSRARQALEKKDFYDYTKLMQDLLALESCLVTEVNLYCYVAEDQEKKSA